MDDIFSADEAKRLTDLVDVVWGRDDPMPLDEFNASLPEAFAVVSAGWRYGDVLDDAPSLRAILTVSGGWPPELDYARCFARGIRVLSRHRRSPRPSPRWPSRSRLHRPVRSSPRIAR